LFFSKKLVYADFQELARQLWNSGHIDVQVLEQELNEKKVQLVSYQPLLSTYFQISDPEVFPNSCRSDSHDHNGCRI
jgi:hypothetical protein